MGERYPVKRKAVDQLLGEVSMSGHGGIMQPDKIRLIRTVWKVGKTEL
jgi:hypothetical protein